MKSDPDNIRAKAKKKLEEIGDNSPKAQKTIYEYMIREAGYDGYWVADQSLGLSAAVFVPLTPSSSSTEGRVNKAKKTTSNPFDSLSL